MVVFLWDQNPYQRDQNRHGGEITIAISGCLGFQVPVRRSLQLQVSYTVIPLFMAHDILIS